MKSKKTVYIICIIFIIITIFSGYQILSTINEYKISNDTYNNLKEYVNTDSDKNASIDKEIVTPKVDFVSLKEINSDVVAWIYIKDANINYPVVQGKDNDYYLNHLTDMSYNAAGSIFLDYRSKSNLNDRHSIIYGHNMNDGSMFANLNKYKEQEFFNNHSYYVIVTPDKNYKIDIISGYVANVNEDSWKLNFSNDEEFSNWLTWTKEKSFFKSEITPTTEDRIITLSTCSNESNDTRFVLVGILKDN